MQKIVYMNLCIEDPRPKVNTFCSTINTLFQYPHKCISQGDIL